MNWSSCHTTIDNDEKIVGQNSQLDIEVEELSDESILLRVHPDVHDVTFMQNADQLDFGGAIYFEQLNETIDIQTKYNHYLFVNDAIVIMEGMPALSEITLGTTFTPKIYFDPYKFQEDPYYWLYEQTIEIEFEDSEYKVLYGTINVPTEGIRENNQYAWYIDCGTYYPDDWSDGSYVLPFTSAYATFSGSYTESNTLNTITDEWSVLN